jgi:RimJ/RimL family protein N-acetyltransferase
MDWLPDSFTHPERVDLPTGDHLRPIRATDVDIDYPAVMSNRERLWARYGEPWGWPPATMTVEQDRDDLAHHEAEIASHESFNYAVLGPDERELLGCVYIDPPRPGAQSDHDAVVSWWVVEPRVGTELDQALAEFIPGWLNDVWGFQAVDFSP